LSLFLFVFLEKIHRKLRLSAFVFKNVSLTFHGKSFTKLVKKSNITVKT